jgi:hypothetical protein
LSESREESFPDSLALKSRVNLHASQHNCALFWGQWNDADQVTVMFREEHCILGRNPAAVAPFGVEVCRSRNVLTHRASKFYQHNCTVEWA